MDHAERRRRPRRSLDSLEGLTPESSWWRGLSRLLLLLATVGDLVSFYTVVAGMMPSAQSSIVWVLTVAFASAAVGVMHVIGRTTRNLREGVGGLGRVALAVMSVSWLALGVAAFWVRTQVTPSTGSAGTVFGGDPSVGAASASADQLLAALILAALYVGSGILAFWIGFSDHHPRMGSYLSLRERLDEQREEYAAAQQQAQESEQRAQQARDDVGRLEQQAAVQRTLVDAEIAELKELARIHVAGLLGDPATTNNLTTGRASGAPALGDNEGGPGDGMATPRPGGPPRPDSVLSTATPLPPDTLNGHGHRVPTR
jgi:hypothetical protein